MSVHVLDTGLHFPFLCMWFLENWLQERLYLSTQTWTLQLIVMWRESSQTFYFWWSNSAFLMSLIKTRFHKCVTLKRFDIQIFFQGQMKWGGSCSQVQHASPRPPDSPLLLHHTSHWQAISLLDSKFRLRDHFKHSRCPRLVRTSLPPLWAPGLNFGQVWKPKLSNWGEIMTNDL